MADRPSRQHEGQPIRLGIHSSLAKKADNAQETIFEQLGASWAVLALLIVAFGAAFWLTGKVPPTKGTNKGSSNNIFGGSDPFQPAGTSSWNSAVNAAQVTVPGKPRPDIGLQISHAFATLQAASTRGQVGTVYVPAGSYTFTNTITIPSGSGTTPYSEALICDPGAHLNYNGSGDALLSEPNGNGTLIPVGNADVRIIGCNISSSAASPLHGMHFLGFYGIYLRNNHVSGFNTLASAGYFFDGAGAVTAINNTAQTDYYGVELKSNQTTSTAANAIHWQGGLMQTDHWGWADINSSYASKSYNSTVENVDFEGNGEKINSVYGGDIILQNTANTIVEHNYAETSYGSEQIWIDSVVVQGQIQIIGNELDNPGGGVTLGAVNILASGNAANIVVEGNFIVPAPSQTYFIDGEAPGARIYASDNNTTFTNEGRSKFIYPQKLVGTITTSASSSDTLTGLDLFATGTQCSAQAINSTAAALTGVYIPATTTVGSVTIYHSPTAGGTFAIYCVTPYL